MLSKTVKDKFILIIKGFCMGAADVVPGVSGGTMALVLGIYTRLINAIKSFDVAWLRSIPRLDRKIIFGRPDFTFIVPLITGIVLALIFFTRIISLPGLIETNPVPVYSLFSGLIIGSICVLVYKVHPDFKSGAVFLVAGTITGYYVFNLVPVNTPETALFIFLCGAISITAMMLPGISGSFILLILKKYSYIFHALGHLQFSILLPFLLGIVCGLALFSRLLAWLLRNFYQKTIFFICGLLAASMTVVWPFQERTFVQVNGKNQLLSSEPYFPELLDRSTAIALILLLVGILVVILINFHAKESEPA